MDTDTSNPWKTLTNEEVYESPWIKLTRHEVINPGGKRGTYSVVHFKNYALGIVPLDENFNTWIVGQYRYPVKQFTWEIPEGGGDLKAEPLESAKRELREECGILADKWTKIQEMQLSNSATDELSMIYIAQDLHFTDPEPDDNEKLYVRKIHFNEFYEMVMKGEIIDSLSVTAALKIKLMMENKEL